MKKINRVGAKLASGICLLSAATGAQASKIVSDSIYDRFALTDAASPGYYSNQLTAWLGKGSLTLTSIFDGHMWGDNHLAETGEKRFQPYPSELNAIVAGKGPTITMMRVGVNGLQDIAIIGWYNPLNGVTAVGGNAGEDSYDAFIFNLTSNRVLRPEYEPSYSEDQRISNVGAGNDLFLADMLPGRAESYMDNYSDALSYSGYPHGLLWNPNHPNNFTSYYLSVAEIAVYSVSVDSLAAPAAVPEPATWAMMIVGFGLMGGVLRRRRISTKVSFA